MSPLLIVIATVVAYFLFRHWRVKRKDRAGSGAGETLTTVARLIPQDQIERDDDDVMPGAGLNMTDVSVQLRIGYVGYAGKKTERVVNVRQFGSLGNDGYFSGRCSLRNANRTFRIASVTHCVDEETGERISDISALLQKKYEASPERSRDRLIEDEYDTLRVLLYVAKADGQLRAAERLVLHETCSSLAADPRLLGPIADGIISAIPIPNLQAFRLAVGRLAKRDQSLRNDICAAASRIANSGKKVNPSTLEAVEYIEKRLTPSQ